MFKRIINYLKKNKPDPEIKPYNDYVYLRLEDGVESGVVSKIGNGLSGTVYLFEGLAIDKSVYKFIAQEFTPLCYHNDSEIPLNEFIFEYNYEIKRRAKELKDEYHTLKSLLIKEKTHD